MRSILGRIPPIPSRQRLQQWGSSSRLESGFPAAPSLVLSMVQAGPGRRRRQFQTGAAPPAHYDYNTSTSTSTRNVALSAPTAGQTRWFSSINARLQSKGPRQELERLEIKDAKPEEDEEGVCSSKAQKGEDKLGQAMTKGKLLTTPSRLFKLLLPLSTKYHRDHKDIEPIAFLIHPQQPLSHLERLIQAEIPLIKTKDGQARAPSVSFIALQLEDNPIRPRKALYEGTEAEVRKLEELGQVKEEKKPSDDDTYTYLRRSEPGGGEKSMEHRFVRWSQSTEVGDFIRDAARAREFIVSVESAPAGQHQIHVAVPSFNERTHFLRMRLRKISDRIKNIADIKHECDALAHRGAQRVAMGGFGVLAFWWCLVYKLTFETDLGWDTMEPVTYLVSLSTLMGGYLWFLYHNREISYRSALDFTINARQKKLYERKGVDLRLWESLIDEGNSLRKEIKSIAAEYDEDWDELKDERDQRVTEALKQERAQKNGSRQNDNDADD
ncbi:hypothetical protein ASPACDRAFT_75582 [Aspergillus aculeatus ATCC 16872]|uniref:Calcium uniporter protein n=1 Tax=Aspergillus aculeatus (strain ATCC 16872 / CBS 172.66 / WB 5094) TaxID=690307 RepID=A0A1L9X6Z6_ASPA1|nr:uncharacterized protein ASPACDRAFT_75582 [Aspergillus aculeatus ATCC 16872]OJK04099.1 hypothetical protein ASPACDRAFT_75582 [Aspergillus aculeatus ATCC 16872]